MSNVKFTDAQSIVGPELATMVEKLFQEEKIERTDAAEIVIRSIEEAATAITKSADSWRDLAEELSQAQLLELLKKLSDDGNVEDDDLASKINAMLNATTDRSKETPMADNTEQKPVEKAAETAVEAPTEKCDVEVYKPYGGATSLDQATEYLRSLKLEDAVYRVFNTFMGVAQNIMSSDNTVEGRMEQMSALLNDCQKMLTPDALLTLSRDREVKLDLSPILAKLDELAKPAEVTRTAELHPTVEKFNTEFANAITLKGDERVAALQGILSGLGEDFTQINRTLAEQEQNLPPAEKPALSTADIEAVVRSTVGGLQSDVATLTQQISQLAQVVSGLQSNLVVSNARAPQPAPQKVMRPTPVQKSITVQTQPPSLTQRAPGNNGKGLSISEIVNRTVFAP